MKKTGTILKNAREEKGLSLHEIGLSLKINSKILKAIEDGDTENLPAKTFLRGFVQSYANYLHLDRDLVLQTFYEEMGSTTPQPFIRENSKANIEIKSEPQEEMDFSTETEAAPTADKDFEQKIEEKVEHKKEPLADPNPPQEALVKKNPDLNSLQDNKIKKSVGWLVVAILLVVLIGFTKKMIDKYSKEAQVPSAEVAQTMEGATPVISEVSEDEAAEEIEESPVESNSASTTIEEVAEVAPETPTAPVQKEEPVEEPPTETVSASPNAPTEAPAEAAKKEEPAIPAHKPVELIVEALDAVEIEYSSAAGKPQKIKLSSEQVHTFKSKGGLKIKFSNGGAVNLILNGRDIGIPGDLGKPINLTY